MEDASGLELTAQNVEATLDEIRWAAGLCLGLGRSLTIS